MSHKVELEKIVLEIEILNRLIEIPENDFEKETNIIKKVDLAQKATLIIEKINKKKIILICIIYFLFIMTFAVTAYMFLDIIHANTLIKGFTIGVVGSVLFAKYIDKTVREREYQQNFIKLY